MTQPKDLIRRMLSSSIVYNSSKISTILHSLRTWLKGNGNSYFVASVNASHD